MGCAGLRSGLQEISLNTIRHNLFRDGFMLTIAASLALFARLAINDDINWLAMITVVGAPFACWLLWVAPDRKQIRIAAPLLYIAFVGPAVFGWVVFLYLPGLAAVLAGPSPETPERTFS